MDIKVVETPEAFDLPEWRLLHSADPRRHVFNTPEWNRMWWEEFGEGKSLFVLTFLDPEPVGLAALVLDRTELGGRVRFLGGDDLTDYIGPLVAGEEHHPAVADALVQFLRDEIGGWGYFEANCLPVPFGFAEWLVEAADRRGLGFTIEQGEVTAVLLLPGSFDAYLDGLRPKLRHELRRKMRRFDREAPGSTVTTATTDTLVADVLSFVDLHRGSEGLKGKFMAPERATFFARVAETFQPMAILSLDFLEVPQRRLASTFSFQYESVFYLYNSAYDPEFRALSPGLVLTARLIERSIDQGFRRFDFLRGPERYKFDLGAEALPLHSVRITNRRRL